MSGEPKSLVLEHYRELQAGAYGEPLQARDRYAQMLREQIAEHLARAIEEKVQRIELRGPVLNPTSEHASHLARAFLETPDELRIAAARWLPDGKVDDSLLPLLRRVLELEIDFPSSSTAAQSLLRDQYDHRAVGSTLEWLHARGIEPTLSVTVGLPGESEEALLETLRQAYSLQPAAVRIRILSVRPGSYLALEGPALGLQWQPTAPFQAICHPLANSAELAWMIRVARASAIGFSRWKRSSRAGPHPERSLVI